MCRATGSPLKVGLGHLQVVPPANPRTVAHPCVDYVRRVDPLEFVRTAAPKVHKDLLPWSYAGPHFVTADSRRDAVDVEGLVVELNRPGYTDAINIEWEDKDAEKWAGAVAPLHAVHVCNLPPDTGRHANTIKARSPVGQRGGRRRVTNNDGVRDPDVELLVAGVQTG
jgi:hypothetical protein